jgi:hypothetical protein
MARYLKMNARLRGVLEEAALTSNVGAATTRNETLSFKWDPDDATTVVSFTRAVGLDGNQSEVSRSKWTASNVPEIGTIVNGGGDAEANLAGSTTLTITSPGNATLYGAVKADLEVWVSPLSKANQACTHPSIRPLYKGAITNLAGANTITVDVEFPSIDGTKIPGLGTAKVVVVNKKQQVESDPFSIEIV